MLFRSLTKLGQANHHQVDNPTRDFQLATLPPPIHFDNFQTVHPCQWSGGSEKGGLASSYLAESQDGWAPCPTWPGYVCLDPGARPHDVALPTPLALPPGAGSAACRSAPLSTSTHTVHHRLQSCLSLLPSLPPSLSYPPSVCCHSYPSGVHAY